MFISSSGLHSYVALVFVVHELDLISTNWFSIWSYSYSTNPYELIKVYRPPEKTEAAIQAIQILTDLQNLVLATKLPHTSGHPDIKLQKWQHDISSDPKKVRFYFFLALYF